MLYTSYTMSKTTNLKIELDRAGATPEVLAELWDGIYKWVTKYASNHAWKVRPEYDTSDIVQEGYFKMCLLISKQPELIKDTETLYRKIRVSTHRKLLELARRRSYVKETTASDITEDGRLLIAVDGQNERFTRSVDLQDAPEEFRILVAFLSRDISYLENPFGYKYTPDAGRKALDKVKFRWPHKNGQVLIGDDLLWAIVERGMAKARNMYHYAITDERRAQLDLKAMLLDYFLEK